jgi:chemotaxis protein methyltransferase CheR
MILINSDIKTFLMDNYDQTNTINVMYKTQLEDKEFKRLSAFITEELGIKMPEVKRTMLQSRLQKRLNDIQKSSFKEYLDFVFSREGDAERTVMMDIVTTNKTDFFREPGHFEYMTETMLPEYAVFTKKPVLKVWSAGCSSGEEPYTLAIVLSEFKEKCKDFDFHITATDISTRMLQKAETAIYAEERVAPVSENLKKKYLLKSKNLQSRTVRIIPELRTKVNFGMLNFMDDDYQVNGLFDVIFCRNVLIYFDRQTQEAVINKLCTKLKPGGYFYLGHSESITNFKVPLKQIKSTIFIKN